MQRTIVVLFLSLCVLGCSNNNPQGRVAVQGSVSLEGKPIQEGSIQFESLPEFQPTVLSGGVIRQGTFSITDEQGLIPGQEYKVRIQSVVEVAGTRVESDDPMLAQAEFQDIVPPQYGSASTLTFTATKESPNIFDCQMTAEIK